MLDDSLHLFGATVEAQWDPGVKYTDAIYSGWPASRDGHSAVFNVANGEMTIFGGRTASDYSNDTWFIYRLHDTDAGPVYHGITRAATSSIKPSTRYRHTAVIPGDNTMIIFGGRNLLVANNDVYHLIPNGSDWRWRKIMTTSTPSARQNHTAVWDSENNCMLVFGGTGVSSFVDDLPSDSALYRFTLDDSTWTPAVVDSDTTFGNPHARYGHAMVLDEIERYVGPTGAPDADHEHRFILFGGMGNGGLLNDMWVLWVPNAGSGAHYKWQKVSPPGTVPSARYRFAMSDDRSNDRLVISGGAVAGDSATASTYSVVLDHLTASNDRSWTVLPAYPRGPVTGHTLSEGATNWAFGQEVFDPSTGEWTVLGTKKRQDWYPFGFVAPQTDSVRVFYAGPSERTSYLNLSGSPSYWRPFPSDTTNTFRGGSAVMYLPGKIMRCGSRDTDQQLGSARGMTQTLDLGASPTPSAWTVTDSMANRVNHNLVILPTGTVLAFGGTQTISNPLNEGPVFRPQIWRPATATWTSMTGVDTLAADSTIRGYHSNAILLPDGRVLSVSGNPTEEEQDSQGALDARRATIYCPPYMFDGSGNLKSRVPFSAPDSIAYGGTFNICIEGSGHRVSKG